MEHNNKKLTGTSTVHLEGSNSSNYNSAGRAKTAGAALDVEESEHHKII